MLFCIDTTTSAADPAPPLSPGLLCFLLNLLPCPQHQPS